VKREEKREEGEAGGGHKATKRAHSEQPQSEHTAHANSSRHRRGSHVRASSVGGGLGGVRATQSTIKCGGAVTGAQSTP
jgi:hypothetical protein